MKPSLQFRLSQHLTLTPQLQQSIRLLQLSTVELNQEIDRMLMENPALEREDAEGLGIALRHLQNLEPAGVGARSPGECLALQLRIMPDEPARRLALDIVEKHLELLASRDYTRLKNITGAGEEALRAAQRLIQALNPRPGAA